MMNTPLVSVVTTGWNHSYLLKNFINSLEAVTPPEWAAQTELVVVNNASVDDTAPFLDEWRQTPTGMGFKHVIHTDTNLGYAGGNNLGVRAARGEYLFLVNNDVLFDSNPIEHCLRVYQENPRAILGRKLIRRRGPWNSLNGQVVCYLEGWCLFASASICRELGFWRESTFTGVFDETFSPAFFEDIDLSLRASLKQIALRQVAIPVRHLGSRTTKMTPSFPYMRVIKENHEKFVAKWRHLQTPAVEPETAARVAAMSGSRFSLGGLGALRNGR
jgi:GT2 family glycosyltransferase